MKKLILLSILLIVGGCLKRPPAVISEISTFFTIDFTKYTEEGFLRSEEHTSELQSRRNLVCRLLLEKKKKTHYLAAVFDE